MPGVLPSTSNWHGRRRFWMCAMSGIAIVLLILSKEAPTAFGCIFNSVPWHGYSITDFAVPLLLYAIGSNIAAASVSCADGSYRPLWEAVKLLVVSFIVDEIRYDSPAPITLRLSGIFRQLALASVPLALVVTNSPGRTIQWHDFYSFSSALVTLYIALTYGLQSCDSPTRAYEPQCSAAGSVDVIMRGVTRQSIELNNFHRGLLASRECPSAFDLTTPKYDAWIWLDPHGLYGTINAATAVLIAGYLEMFQPDPNGAFKVQWASQFAFLSLILHSSTLSPVQHELYTTSYVLLSSAVAVGTEELIKALSQWELGYLVLMPLVAVGSNAVWVLCIVHFGLLELLLRSIRIPSYRGLLPLLERVCLTSTQYTGKEICRNFTRESEVLFGMSTPPSRITIFDAIRSICHHWGGGASSWSEFYIASFQVALLSGLIITWMGKRSFLNWVTR